MQYMTLASHSKDGSTHSGGYSVQSVPTQEYDTDDDAVCLRRGEFADNERVCETGRQSLSLREVDPRRHTWSLFLQQYGERTRMLAAEASSKKKKAASSTEAREKYMVAVERRSRKRGG